MDCGQPSLRYTASRSRRQLSSAVDCGQPSLRYTSRPGHRRRRPLWTAANRRSDTLHIPQVLLWPELAAHMLLKKKKLLGRLFRHLRAISEENGHTGKLPLGDMKQPNPASFWNPRRNPSAAGSRRFLRFKVAGVHRVLELREPLTKKELSKPCISPALRPCCDRNIEHRKQPHGLISAWGKASVL